MPLHGADVDLNALWNQVNGVAGAAAVSLTSGIISGTLDVRGNFVNGTQASGGIGVNVALANVGTVTAETVGLQQAAQTLTLTGGYTTQRFALFAQPTLSGAQTITNAATVAIANAPTTAGGATITNPYALWVQGGATRVDGGLGLGASPSVAGVLDVRTVGATLNGANPGGDSLGDKVALYGYQFGLGVQSGRLVVASGTAVGLRLGQASGQSTGGSDAWTFFVANPSQGSEQSTMLSFAPTFTISGSYATQRFNLFQQPTLTGAFTVTNAATVAIANAPAAAGGATLTNSYAFWVQAGKTELDGGMTLGAGSNLTADSGTATGAAGAVTLNKQTGTITTESLSTAGAAAQTYTVTNSVCTAAARVFVTVKNGTNTTQPVYATNVVPANGSFTVDLRNGTVATALNGTLKFDFWVVL